MLGLFKGTDYFWTLKWFLKWNYFILLTTYTGVIMEDNVKVNSKPTITSRQNKTIYKYV